MFRNTRFSDLMKGLPRDYFCRTVEGLESDKYSKGFSTWDHLIAMVFAQISGCRSLRELEVGFNSHETSHYHLGTGQIKRSTLADANSKRSPEVFASVCSHLMQQVHRALRKELKTFLYLLDSSPIPLKGLGYDDWTLDNTNSRTQGLKLHLLFSADISSPVSAEITAPNVNDIEMVKNLDIEKGATYVFDKGYCDYNWWHQIHKNGAKFVTRLKKNAGITVIEERRIPRNAVGIILEDAKVQFKNRRPGGHRINHYHGTPLRKIVVDRPDKKTPLVIATNDFKRSALAIAELYKRRWEIELFFKWLKQNLRLKKFLGRNENAVKIQIFTALISYLLVMIYKGRQGIEESLVLVLATLKTGLFQRPETDYVMARRHRERRKEYESLQGALAL